jgi:hypothetical protein
MARRKPRVQTRQDRYKKRCPWVRLVEWARRRCNDTESKWYKFYGARGIVCTITAADAKRAWIECSAHLLKRPSLDRIESNKGYVAGNIRVIEFNANARMAWDESFKFLFNGAPTPPHGEQPVPTGDFK